MKFIKCLRKHTFVDYIGIVIDATKGPRFYTADDIIQTKSHLLNYKVLSITATNMTIDGKQVPAVLYYLGI